MGTPTQHYVDPVSGSNSNGGTSDADAWADMTYALANLTQDATNGNQVNLKSSGTDSPSAQLTIPAGFGIKDPLIVRGYDSVANDGGIGVIDGGAGNFTLFSTSQGAQFIDLELRNTGTADVMSFTNYQGMFRCTVHNTSGHGINMGSHNNIVGCYVHDCGDRGIYGGGGGLIIYNYCKNTNASNRFVDAISTASSGCGCYGNIVSIDGASNGIYLSNWTGQCWGNSVFSNAGTGKGIVTSANGTLSGIIINNLIEGFSGTGGIGLHLDNGNNYHEMVVDYNAIYNCTTSVQQDTAGQQNVYNEVGNESLSASPFAKSGSDTFANRLTYFAPVDTGNVIGAAGAGAYPVGSYFDKGAVQDPPSSGGGSGSSFMVTGCVGVSGF